MAAADGRGAPVAVGARGGRRDRDPAAAAGADREGLAPTLTSSGICDRCLPFAMSCRLWSPATIAAQNSVDFPGFRVTVTPPWSVATSVNSIVGLLSPPFSAETASASEMAGLKK